MFRISCKKEDSGAENYVFTDNFVKTVGAIAVVTMLYIDKMPGKDGFGHVYSEKLFQEAAVQMSLLQ